VEGLSKIMQNAKKCNEMKGLKVTPVEYLSHLHFVDDMILFGVWESQ